MEPRFGDEADPVWSDEGLLAELAGDTGLVAHERSGSGAARATRPVDTDGLESIFSRSGDRESPVMEPVSRNQAKARTDDTHRARHTTARGDGGRYEARQVSRIVRGVGVWSLFRVSLLFYVCVWVVVTIAGLILWFAARSVGIMDNVEKFMAELLADESFSIDGIHLLRASLMGGLVMVLSGAAFTALLGVLFNLICQVTGGVRLRVVELETARPVADRGRQARRAGRRR